MSKFPTVETSENFEVCGEPLLVWRTEKTQEKGKAANKNILLKESIGQGKNACARALDALRRSLSQVCRRERRGLIS